MQVVYLYLGGSDQWPTNDIHQTGEGRNQCFLYQEQASQDLSSPKYKVAQKCNTSGTRGGLGFRDRKMAVKSRKNGQNPAFFHKKIIITEINIFVVHISSSYAKNIGENKISSSGVFPKWVKSSKRRKRRRERETESQ